MSLGVLQCGSAATAGPPPPPLQEGSRPQAGGHSRQTCADGHLLKRAVFTVKTSGRDWSGTLVRAGVSLALSTFCSCLVEFCLTASVVLTLVLSSLLLTSPLGSGDTKRY